MQACGWTSPISTLILTPIPTPTPTTPNPTPATKEDTPTTTITTNRNQSSNNNNDRLPRTSGAVTWAPRRALEAVPRESQPARRLKRARGEVQRAWQIQVAKGTRCKSEAQLRARGYPATSASVGCGCRWRSSSTALLGLLGGCSVASLLLFPPRPLLEPRLSPLAPRQAEESMLPGTISLCASRRAI